MTKEKEKEYRKKRDAMRVRIIEQELLGYDTREDKIKYNKFVDEMISKGIKFIPRKGYPVHLDLDSPVKIIRKRSPIKPAVNESPKHVHVLDVQKHTKPFKLTFAWTIEEHQNPPKSLQTYLEKQGGKLIDDQLNDVGMGTKERILTYKFGVSEDKIDAICSSAQFILDMYLTEYQGVIFVKKKN